MDQHMRRARGVQAAIESILISDWDPIEVKDEPLCRDEYSRYVGRVYHALASGASEEEIVSLLQRIESEAFGFTRAPPCFEAARKLRALDVRVT